MKITVPQTIEIPDIAPGVVYTKEQFFLLVEQGLFKGDWIIEYQTQPSQCVGKIQDSVFINGWGVEYVGSMVRVCDGIIDVKVLGHPKKVTRRVTLNPEQTRNALRFGSIPLGTKVEVIRYNSLDIGPIPCVMQLAKSDADVFKHCPDPIDAFATKTISYDVVEYDWTRVEDENAKTS
jgi:hypothetical protein